MGDSEDPKGLLSNIEDSAPSATASAGTLSVTRNAETSAIENNNV